VKYSAVTLYFNHPPYPYLKLITSFTNETTTFTTFLQLSLFAPILLMKMISSGGPSLRWKQTKTDKRVYVAVKQFSSFSVESFNSDSMKLVGYNADEKFELNLEWVRRDKKN